MSDPVTVALIAGVVVTSCVSIVSYTAWWIFHDENLRVTRKGKYAP